MLVRILKASERSAGVIPANILTSTDRTAADAFVDLDGYQITLHDRA